MPALLVLLCAGSAAAQTWQPPEPNAKGWDWIRLVSGEWLGGTLEGMRDLDLEFDSDKLDLLKLDWSDVAELRSPRTLTYRFDDLGTFTGTAVMRADTVIIRTVEGDQRLPRERLLLILEGGRREIDFWSVKVTVGLVGRSGNTSQSDLNSTLWVRRMTPDTRTTLDYSINYGELDGNKTVDNNNVTLGLDILVTSGFFINPLTVNYFRDPFQNIESKTTLAAGVGYDILRGGNVEWNVGLGGGYQWVESSSVAPGADRQQENGTMVAYTEIDWDITDDINCLSDYHAEVGVPEVSRAFHHAKAAFAIDILGDVMDLNFAVMWDRVENPEPDANGIVPVRDDFRTTFGVGLEF